MSVDTKYFVDVFGDIVSNVRSEYDLVSGEKPFYLYGHILDILERLSTKDRSSTLKFKKYPLIALIQDFEEQTEGWSKYGYTLPEIKVIIVAKTLPGYDSTTRYAKTFKPTLYPIYDLLLTKIGESNFIDVQTSHIQKSKFDRVYWGREKIFGVDGHVFNDYLDAIEIRFKNLQVFKHSNC